MFDIGWSEMAVVALIALIVIGPKELPQAMRMAAKWVRKARGLAREFQSGVDEMIREAELEDARKAVETARHVNIDKALETAVDPTGSVREEQRELETAAKPETSGAGVKAKESEKETGTTPAKGRKADSDGAAEERKGTEGKDATVVTQPLNIAPPHSLTPPAETEVTSAEPRATGKAASDDEAAGKRAERT